MRAVSSSNSIGFLLTFAAPAIVALSAWLGVVTGYADWFAVLPLLLAFGVVPLISISGVNWSEPLPAHPRSVLGQAYYRSLPLLAVPAQLAALAVAIGHWSGPALGTAGRFGWLLSVGIFSALFAVTVAHELIHHRNRVDRVLGGILLSTACFGTFKIVHLRVHHRFVGTEVDFSSARRGNSIYRFWLRCLIGNPCEALRQERIHLRRLGRPLWRSELGVWYGLSAVWLALAIAVWGWRGGAFFLLQSLVAILALDWTNYVQHYGLRRRTDAKGRYERVRPHHAWSMQCRISNLALLNLLRHGDHHTHPMAPYHALAHTPAPAYPYPFGFMMVLALVTPLFRRIVDPLLDRLPIMAER